MMAKETALITGGSRGIGFGIAKALAEHHFDVAINGVREQEQASEAIRELKKTGANVIYCQGDISCSEDRISIIKKMKTAFGRLDVLVNNAGVAPKQRIDPLKATTESYDRVMNINLKGPYFLTQLAANWMIEECENRDEFSGVVINIGSISATVVSPDRGEYCISKAGFAMHNKIWATRLAEYNIPVYEIRPGITKTDMTEAVEDKYDKLIAEGLTLQKRWGYPEDVGKAVLSLAKGNFPYSTGQVIMVDGGLTMQRL